MARAADQKGAGIMAVVAGVGVAAALGAAALSAIQQAGKTGKNAEYRFDVQMLVAEIGVTLKNSQACYNTFNGLDASNASGIPSVRNEANQEVFKLDLIHGHTGAKIDEFRLEDQAGLGDGVQVVAGNKGSTYFLIKFKPKMRTIFENREVVGKVRLAVRTDGAGRILSCFATGAGEDPIWKQTAGNPTRIFYDAGNVGVGLSAPNEKLDVDGWISGQSSLGKIALGGDASEFKFRVDGPGPLNFENLAGGKADLQVNEVRPQGVLQLTSAAIPCTAPREGALRYEPSIRRVQVCSSGSWQTLTVVRWCLPPWRYAPAHDTNDVVMYMREDDAARLPQGHPCLPGQRDTDRPKRDADLHYTNSGDHGTNDLGRPGWYFNSDDGGKRRKCINNYNCRDYRDLEQ